MGETELTKRIKHELYRYTKADGLGVYGCFETVMGESRGYGKEKVDYITMNSDNVFRCYEIKITREDLHSKAKLSFYGDYNYLVVPEDLADEALKFLRNNHEHKVGVLVYHSGTPGRTVPYISTMIKPVKEHCRIEQKVSNLHNMVRSMSRYVTERWKEGKA